jgi:hypothetical protein
MKSLTSLLFHSAFLGMSLFLFSCDRAVDDKTEVVLYLPNAQSAAKFSSNLTTLIDTTPLLLPEVGISTGVIANEYIPGDSPLISTAYCYLVAVENEESDPDKQAAANPNYCGKKISDSGGFVLDSITSKEVGSISPDERFGVYYAGLVDANAAQTIPINLGLMDVSGPPKTFKVFGFPATTAEACQFSADAPFNKAALYQPRLIGKTTGVKLLASDRNSITVNVSTTTDANTVYYDDCLIQESKLDYPEATDVLIDQDTFPYNYMRSKAGTNDPAVCQPVKFTLKSNDTSLARAVPAAFKYDKRLSLSRLTFAGQIPTYGSYDNCVNDKNGSSEFVFPRNQTQHLRWIAINEAGSFAIYLKADLSQTTFGANEITPTASVAPFSLVPHGTTLLDVNAPKVLQKGICYKATAYFRDIDGSSATTTTFTFKPVISSTTSMNVFATDLSCRDGTPAINPTAGQSYGGSLPSINLWLKYSGTAADGVKVDFSGTVSTGVIVPKLTFTSAAAAQTLLYTDGANIKNIGQAIGITKYKIPNDGACYPLSIFVSNRLGAGYAVSPSIVNFNFLLADNVTAPTFDQVPLRYKQVVLNSGDATDGYQLRKDAGSGCSLSPSTDMLPITDTDVGNYATSDGTLYKFYIKTDGVVGGVTKTGRRRLQIFYGGTAAGTDFIGYPSGHIDFELTAPDF